MYVDQRALARTLTRYSRTSIFLVTLFATLTPFCSCGTVAVVLSMIASTVPWGPIVAFMVSSPLMSPSQYIYTAGVMGWTFANTLLVASIALGVGAGYVADALDKRGLLKNQARLGSMTATDCADSACSAGVTGELAPASAGCGCNSATTEALKRQATLEAGSREPACGCSAGSDAGVPPTNAKAAALPPGRGLSQTVQKVRLGEVVAVGLPLGLRILAFFLAFSYIGHVLTLAFPTQWMLGLFGQGRFYAVPLAATLGVPLYINAEVSMPVIKSFMQMGMGPGAALALTITGAGTCIGAITGAFVIARARVVALVLASLWIGSVLAGYLYDVIMALAWYRRHDPLTETSVRVVRIPGQVLQAQVITGILGSQDPT